MDLRGRWLEAVHVEGIFSEMSREDNGDPRDMLSVSEGVFGAAPRRLRRDIILDGAVASGITTCEM